MRVFWPRNSLQGVKTGVSLLVGWVNPGGDVVVVCALPTLEYDLVQQQLQNEYFFENYFANSPKKQAGIDLYKLFHPLRLSVVGTHYSSKIGFSGDMVSPYGVVILDWKVLKPQNTLMIYYDPPNPSRMQFFTTKKSTLFNPCFDKPNELEPFIRYHLQYAEPKPDNIDKCIAQINCVYELQPFLRQMTALLHSLSTAKTIGMRRRRKSLSHDMIAQVVIHDPMFNIFIRLRKSIEWILVFLETAKLGKCSVLSLFCTAQQIHLRLNQFCYLPLEYVAIQKRHQSSGWHIPQLERNDAYNRFCNHVWLYLNDLLFGVYIFFLLKSNTEEIVNGTARIFHQLMINLVIRASVWMTMFPAGFKLNPQLGQFIGDITNWTVQSWSMFCSLFLFNKRVGTAIVNVIGLSGVFGGVTLQISLVVDLISIAGFHIYLLYQSMARVYAQQLSLLSSLFRLFRGLKYNMLRRRVDHGNYDMNQLFLGTIMFTVSLFLLPTVFAFYFVFMVARLAVFVTSAILCVMLSFLNHFPLFPLLLRLKSPERIPSGIYFIPRKIVPNESRQGDCTVLVLKSQPMRLSEIFQQYTDTINRFANNTFNLKALLGLLTGHSLQFQQAELYASLYSVLPRKRDSIEETYKILKDYFTQSRTLS